MASFVRRIARLRFETPLAAALGVSGAFAASVAPLDGMMPGMPGAGRWLLASAALIVLPPIAWAAMRPRRARRVAEPASETPAVETPIAEEEVPVMRIRRADRHPDAPRPQPIRASRDLGTPFMAVEDTPANAPEPARFEEIAAETPVAADEPLVLDTLAPDPVEAIEPETIEAEAVEPETVEPEAVEPVAVEPEAVSIEAIAPDEAAPAEASDDHVDAGMPDAEVPDDDEEESPVARNDSLAAMMDRLSRGVERRGGVPPRRSPEAIARPVQPALRDALATLNRLADRR